MRALNEAVEGANAFRDMLSKIERRRAVTPAWPTDPEVAAWNAEVDRKRAEKQARKLATKAKS